MSVTRYFKLTLTLMFFSLISFSQIRNADFEIVGMNEDLLGWKLSSRGIHQIHVDSTVSCHGKNSIRILSPSGGTTKYATFSQTLALNCKETTKLFLSCFVKAKNNLGSYGLTCVLLDSLGNEIGFENTDSGQSFDTTEGSWTKYSLPILVDKNVVTIRFWGYLQGQGSVWFDNFGLQPDSSSNGLATTEVTKYINKLIKIIKDNSVYADLVNWQEVEANVKTFSKGVQTVEDAEFIVSYLLRKLREKGDNHSSFQMKRTAVVFASNDLKKPSVKLIKDHIGYINIPDYSSANRTSQVDYATMVQNEIKAIDDVNIKGWIVDLRDNTGGNMHPMLAALGPLLSDRTLGYFIGKNGREVDLWYYKDGEVGHKKRSILQLKNHYSLKHKTAKIALLIGPKTSSSGEFVAVSFFGDENVKSFGQPSKGMTTGILAYQLSHASTLFLAVTQCADKNKNNHRGKLKPDVLTNEIDKFSLDSAIKWIDTN